MHMITLWVPSSGGQKKIAHWPILHTRVFTCILHCFIVTLLDFKTVARSGQCRRSICNNNYLVHTIIYKVFTYNISNYFSVFVTVNEFCIESSVLCLLHKCQIYIIISLKGL